MSQNAFFIDPFCDGIPCNGMEKKAVMGNLHEQSWEELWNSEQAEKDVYKRQYIECVLKERQQVTLLMQLDMCLLSY